MKVQAHSNSPLHYQVSILGPAAGRLSPRLATELVKRRLADDDTEPFEVRIKIWRGGQELDWEDDNPRAVILRDNVRRLLREGSLRIGTMGAR